GKSSPTSASAATGTSPRNTTASRSSSAKGPLPDPALLDGSTQPAEKKPEQGMLGEFELPGDDNVRNGKVGGQQQPPGQQGAAGGQQMPMGGLPSMGGGGGPQDPNQKQQQAGGQQSPAGGQQSSDK